MPYADLEKKREYSREHYRRYRAENLEKERARDRERYARNLEKERARQREKARRYYAKKKLEAQKPLAHELTKAQYDVILKDQDYKCKVCGADSPGGPGTFNVDHCQEGKVRGLLCNSCSNMLGHLNSSDTLRAAAQYLEAS